LLNLATAFICKKFLGHGKNASTTEIPLKILSAGLIMIGLYLSGGGGHWEQFCVHVVIINISHSCMGCAIYI